MTATLPQTLQEEVAAIFAPGGPLAGALKGFEARHGQIDMSLKVASAFEANQVAIIEAGTGIGKSFAYLAAALLWAQKSGERVVISTNTIALQEQLMEKDLPIIMRALGLSLKVVLAKGRGNYVCMRKMKDEAGQGNLTLDRESDEIQRISAWSQNTTTGSRAELPFFPLSSTWERLSVDPDACNGQQCQFYKECYFFRARKDIYDAKVIVCNHHLLFADLASRREDDNWEDTAVLPPFQKLIIDESHHIEDVATEYFAARIGRLEFLKLLASLGGESEKSAGRLVHLRKMVGDLPENSFTKKGISKEAFRNKLEIDLSLERREAANFVNDLFDNYLSFIGHFPSLRQDEEAKQKETLRLQKLHIEHAFWKEKIKGFTDRAVKSLDRFVASLGALEVDLAAISNDTFQEMSKSLRVDMMSIAMKITKARDLFIKFYERAGNQEKVHWIEAESYQHTVDVRIVEADCDLSVILRDNLFLKVPSTMLCSATLTTGGKSFSYIKKRFGLESIPKEVIEAKFESDFPYRTNALFGVPTDMPLPEDPNFMKRLPGVIQQLIDATTGNAFVLFTSYTMLRSCYDQVADELQKKGYHLLKQGDGQRKELLRRFKETPRSVLFGTDSFWEGVDVVGDALRSVIIVKLPFQVPSDPLVAARCESIQARGGSPFFEYSVPKAIMKFKQAFGRLIRSKEDRGSVVCLDVRLHLKQYGREFIKSLPDCAIALEPLEALTTRLKQFQKKRK